VRSEGGLSYVWSIDDGKLVRRTVITGRRDEEASRVEIRTELPPGARVLATRFDNLKEGAPALVKAPAATGAKPG
jgi:membrane fusion protein, multidrug efflux system